MRNLEWKSRLADLADAERIAQAIGATFGGDLYQFDTYFHAAGGRLKLRATGGGNGELIFYQRPEDAPTRWSDYFKAPVASPDVLRAVLTRALGVRARVEKTRRLYLYRGARIHLDRVTRLGTFVEFEVPTMADADADAETGGGTGPGGDAEAARATMRELMQAFGLTAGDAITASYGEMIADLR
ncbi:MAG: class IV adenylate cyclase [Gemmatimonadota bacterium]